MNISPQTLARLNEYSNYLEGEQIDDFFQTFGISFSAGHWCGGDFADRFAPKGYNSDNPDFKTGILAEMERVSQAKIKVIIP